jgi:hypothetical protein
MSSSARNTWFSKTSKFDWDSAGHGGKGVDEFMAEASRCRRRRELVQEPVEKLPGRPAHRDRERRNGAHVGVAAIFAQGSANLGRAESQAARTLNVAKQGFAQRAVDQDE